MNGNLSFLRDAMRAVRHNRHEIAEDGAAYIPGARAFIGGAFAHKYAADGVRFGPKTIEKPNRVVGQGLILLLNLLGGHASATSLYLAPFSGNVVPASNWTGATWASLAAEFTAYDESTRLPWTTVEASGTALLTNAAALSEAVLTFATGGPYTIRGAALVGASTKSATTGPLVAASRFGADLSGMTAGGKLALEYGLSALDESDA